MALARGGATAPGFTLDLEQVAYGLARASRDTKSPALHCPVTKARLLQSSHRG